MSNRCFAAKFRSEFRSKVPVSVIQQPKLHRFSLAQYYELGELGLLNQRTELLDGIITDMEPIGPW